MSKIVNHTTTRLVDREYARKKICVRNSISGTANKQATGGVHCCTLSVGIFRIYETYEMYEKQEMIWQQHVHVRHSPGQKTEDRDERRVSQTVKYAGFAHFVTHKKGITHGGDTIYTIL